MEVELLTVPDCPHAEGALRRLHEAATRAKVPAQIVHRVIDTEAEAEARGMRGSPTILIDGVDVNPAPPEVGRLSCLLSPDGGVPPVERLVEALDRGTDPPESTRGASR